MTHCDKRPFGILEDAKSFLCAQISERADNLFALRGISGYACDFGLGLKRLSSLLLTQLSRTGCKTREGLGHRENKALSCHEL